MIRPRFIADACQRGAILWQVLLDDSSQVKQIDCFLGISTDSLVLIEEQSRQIVFVTPCKSILGWSTQTNGLRLYHHQGECLTVHMKDTHGDRDELMEIMDRLRTVTQGLIAQELPLKRNIMGQLGFHVQPNGIVTLVESAGQAWHAGLRQNSRLVEICKVAVSTLTYDQMVDLLKTSLLVTLTVIPPLADGSPRKGCTLQNCKYNEGDYEEDYVDLIDDGKNRRKEPQRQKPVPGNHRIYERSFSPPRSSNSSGYGTGGSSKSFLPVNPEGTGSSSGDEKWYDILQDLQEPQQNRAPAGGTIPTTPKRAQNLQLSQSHHNHFNSPPHSKVQTSHSLPLQPYAQTLNPSLANCIDYDAITKGNKSQFRRPNDPVDYTLVTRPPKIADYPTDYSSSGGIGQNADNLANDRLLLFNDDDEHVLLSQQNGNSSPNYGRHLVKNLSSSNIHNCHRNNHSPRLTVANEAKLRPGVTQRSTNRNSANLSSNFQEELLRLINPDNIEANSCGANPVMTSSIPSVNYHQQQQRHPHSYHYHQHPHQGQNQRVLNLTSTASSSLPSIDFKSAKDDELTSSGGSGRLLDDFALPPDEDWSSLVVDTANKVIKQNVDLANGDDIPAIDASLTSSIGSSSTSVPELQNHLSDLELRVDRETKLRMSLETEVRRLQDENKKLQDQAHAAVQQLRKFTEWFFKNVQRQ